MRRSEAVIIVRTSWVVDVRWERMGELAVYAAGISSPKGNSKWGTSLARSTSTTLGDALETVAL